MREMFSSISVPPRSLTPQRRLSVAASRPIFTQLACRFVIVLPSARRNAAVCLRLSSRGDLLDAVGAAQQRIERDEAERHELGNAACPLLQLADDPHVAGELPGLLDVTEHHGRGRAQARAVRGLDDLDPAGNRQLVRRDPLPDPVVEHLGRGAGSGTEPALDQVVEHRLGRLAGPLAHEVDLHRRVGVEVELGRHLLGQPQPAPVLLERVVGWMPPCMQISVAPNSTASSTRATKSSSSTCRRRASACPGRSRRRRSRRCRRW